MSRASEVDAWLQYFVLACRRQSCASPMCRLPLPPASPANAAAWPTVASAPTTTAEKTPRPRRPSIRLRRRQPGPGPGIHVARLRTGTRLQPTQNNKPISGAHHRVTSFHSRSSTPSHQAPRPSRAQSNRTLIPFTSW
ncbi:hypothetical protein NpPPO83_00006565 [Neofusicoccum parvum]|uniref:Uncharacterized protein n=1 Tax=Neofusicoccum parvum TaxID=310453 RepID=A0ACB5SPM1_9PEZI|nr:hypothetical protein NpPPO83_00006565 [Neofusicoccum parvum]